MFSINKKQISIYKKFFNLLFLMILILTIQNKNIYSQIKNNLSLKTLKILNLKTGYGAKSILISPDTKYVFSINLEAMNIYIFNRESKKLEYKLQFIAHPGKGYNYTTHKWINSYQEKPVEGHFTHNGRFLWVSLHNAGGIVLIDLFKLGLFNPEQNITNENTNSNNNNSNNDENTNNNENKNNNNDSKNQKSPIPKTIDPEFNSYKQAYFYNFIKNSNKKIKLPFFKTGTTPKIISSTSDNKYLFVSNWHSATVSVIDISPDNINNFKKIKDIKIARIPRGLAVSSDNKKLYIADMGSNIIYIISIPQFKKVGYIKVPVNPRHLVIDRNFMYASININSKIVKIDLTKDKIILQNKTKKSARTIALSKDKKFVFVTCYRGNYVQAFSTDDLKLIAQWKSFKGPVGIEVFQDNNYIELWIVNYSTGIIKVIELTEY